MVTNEFIFGSPVLEYYNELMYFHIIMFKLVNKSLSGMQGKSYLWQK